MSHVASVCGDRRQEADAPRTQAVLHTHRGSRDSETRWPVEPEEQTTHRVFGQLGVQSGGDLRVFKSASQGAAETDDGVVLPLHRHHGEHAGGRADATLHAV